MQYSKFPQLPHRPLRGILISGSPHREFRVSCFHCLKNFTSAELCALAFIKAKVCQTETKENEASLFLFDFYIHTCIAISSVRLQAKSLLALTYIFIYCFFLFSLCLTWKFISQLTVDNFCSRKVFYIDMYIYYTWKKKYVCECVCVGVLFFIHSTSLRLCVLKSGTCMGIWKENCRWASRCRKRFCKLEMVRLWRFLRLKEECCLPHTFLSLRGREGGDTLIKCHAERDRTWHKVGRPLTAFPLFTLALCECFFVFSFGDMLHSPLRLFLQQQNLNQDQVIRSGM